MAAGRVLGSKTARREGRVAGWAGEVRSFTVGIPSYCLL